MNKTLLLSCAFAAITTAAMAQNKGISFSSKSHGPTLPVNSDKTTATRYRITGFMLDRHDGATFVHDDSARLISSGNKGPLIIINSEQSIFNTQPDLDFDQQLSFDWNAGTTSFEPSGKGVQTFDMKSNITENMSQTWDGGTSSWENDTKTTYTYDANNNRTSEVYQNWNSGTSSWDNNSKYTYTYNSSNQKTEEIYQYWSSGVWQNSSKTLYTYTAAGRLETEISQSWNGSAWTNDYKDLYTYTGSLPDAMIGQDWVSGAWKNDRKTTYTYTNASATDLTSVLTQDWDNGNSVWENDTKNLITTNATHGITEVISQNWDGSAWENSAKQIYSYNAADLINKLTTQHWNPGAFWETTTNDISQNLFYETYNVPENINDVDKAAGQLTLYPNPASTNLNVRMDWKTTPAAITGAIYTADGRIVQQWSEPAKAATYNTVINTGNLPAGNYNLVLQGDNARAHQQFSVVK